MGRANSKSNEAKWKVKHPSDIARLGFEPRWYKSVANHATSYAVEAWEHIQIYWALAIDGDDDDDDNKSAIADDDDDDNDYVNLIMYLY